MGNTCGCGSAGITVPDIKCNPSDSVTLSRPVRYATYGPENQKRIPHDITSVLRQLYTSGNIVINSVEEAVGNPFPGQESVIKIWFLSSEPDAVFKEDEPVELKGFVSFVTYNPPDAHAYDVTEVVKNLQKKGMRSWSNSNATLGNNFPGQDGKLLKIWYNNGN